LRGLTWALLLGFFNAQVFDIATTEEDVFVERSGRGKELRLRPAILSAIRHDIFEGDSRVFGIDFDKGAHIAVPTLVA